MKTDDQVEILKGPLAGKTGTVVHVNADDEPMPGFVLVKVDEMEVLFSPDWLKESANGTT